MWLLLIFIGVPILEIALFIQVGGALGLWPTLLIVILTAIVGTGLMRAQGLKTLATLQNKIQSGENPAGPIAHGALILVAGVTLLTPGFFTDTVGLLLLVPPVRERLIAWGSSRVTVQAASFGRAPGRQANRPDDGVIETEFEIVDENPTGEPGTSGWTKPTKR